MKPLSIKFSCLLLCLTCISLSAQDDTYRVGQTGVTPPIFTKKVTPVYPEKARDIKLEGYVILEALMTADGSVGDIKVLRGLGKGKFGFEEAAAHALKNWKFKPALVEGHPVDVLMTLKIDFVLKDGLAEVPLLSWSLPDTLTDGVMAPIVQREHAPEHLGATVSLQVTVRLDSNDQMIDFVTSPDDLSKLAHPESIEARLERELQNYTWTTARYDNEPVDSEIAFKVTVPLD